MMNNSEFKKMFLISLFILLVASVVFGEEQDFEKQYQNIDALNKHIIEIQNKVKTVTDADKQYEIIDSLNQGITEIQKKITTTNPDEIKTLLEDAYVKAGIVSTEIEKPQEQKIKVIKLTVDDNFRKADSLTTILGKLPKDTEFEQTGECTKTTYWKAKLLANTETVDKKKTINAGTEGCIYKTSATTPAEKLIAVTPASPVNCKPTLTIKNPEIIIGQTQAILFTIDSPVDFSFIEYLIVGYDASANQMGEIVWNNGPDPGGSVFKKIDNIIEIREGKNKEIFSRCKDHCKLMAQLTNTPVTECKGARSDPVPVTIKILKTETVSMTFKAQIPKVKVTPAKELEDSSFEATEGQDLTCSIDIEGTYYYKWVNIEGITLSMDAVVAAKDVSAAFSPYACYVYYDAERTKEVRIARVSITSAAAPASQVKLAEGLNLKYTYEGKEYDETLQISLKPEGKATFTALFEESGKGKSNEKILAEPKCEDADRTIKINSQDVYCKKERVAACPSGNKCTVEGTTDKDGKITFNIEIPKETQGGELNIYLTAPGKYTTDPLVAQIVSVPKGKQDEKIKLKILREGEVKAGEYLVRIEPAKELMETADRPECIVYKSDDTEKKDADIEGKFSYSWLSEIDRIGRVATEGRTETDNKRLYNYVAFKAEKDRNYWCIAKDSYGNNIGHSREFKIKVPSIRVLNVVGQKDGNKVVMAIVTTENEIKNDYFESSRPEQKIRVTVYNYYYTDETPKRVDHPVPDALKDVVQQITETAAGGTSTIDITYESFIKGVDIKAAKGGITVSWETVGLKQGDKVRILSNVAGLPQNPEGEVVEVKSADEITVKIKDTGWRWDRKSFKADELEVISDYRRKVNMITINSYKGAELRYSDNILKVIGTLPKGTEFEQIGECYEKDATWKGKYWKAKLLKETKTTYNGIPMPAGMEGCLFKEYTSSPAESIFPPVEEKKQTAAGDVDAKINELIQKLRDTNIIEADPIVKEIISYGEPAIKPLIESLPKSDDLGMSNGIVRALGGIGDERAVQPLTNELISQRPGKAAALTVIAALSQIQDRGKYLTKQKDNVLPGLKEYWQKTGCTMCKEEIEDLIKKIDAEYYKKEIEAQIQEKITPKPASSELKKSKIEMKVEVLNACDQSKLEEDIAKELLLKGFNIVNMVKDKTQGLKITEIGFRPIRNSIGGLDKNAYVNEVKEIAEIIPGIQKFSYLDENEEIEIRVRVGCNQKTPQKKSAIDLNDAEGAYSTMSKCYNQYGAECLATG